MCKFSSIERVLDTRSLCGDSSYDRPKKYQVEIPAKIKKEVDLYARDFGTASAIKNLLLPNIQNTLLSEPQLTPGSRSAMMVIKRIGRPNLLNSGMLKKVKDIALETRMAGGVINRRQLTSIATGVVRAINLNLLKEYGGDLVLIDKWAIGVLERLTWSKRKGTTGKIDPSPSF